MSPYFSDVPSLTGDANEFFMSGFGVICIDKKYLLFADFSVLRGLD